jgi:hypothetical protein
LDAAAHGAAAGTIEANAIAFVFIPRCIALVARKRLRLDSVTEKADV